MPTDVWVDKVFFSKLEISNFNWVRYKDGITFGGFGIETTAREMAKIGLCFANTGNYKGQQVVPGEWVESMTSTQIETEFDDEMGYYWWINEPRNIHSMNGHGGQYVYVVPNENLIIVMTAIPNTQDDYQIEPKEALKVVDMVIESCW